MNSETVSPEPSQDLPGRRAVETVRTATDAIGAGRQDVRHSAIWRWPHGLEDAVVVLALAVIIALPLLEIMLRRTLRVGITGSSAFVQHATLILGVVGGAIAARQNRLLSLATAQFLPPGWPSRIARAVSGTAAALIATMLLFAAAQFVRDERLGANTLAYGIPVWTLQLALPIGFGLIAVRILWHTAGDWRGRLVAAGLVIGATAILTTTSVDPARLVTPAFVLLGAATLCGAPIFTVLAGAALILFWWDQSPIASIAVDHYRLVTNPTLPTLPLFTLAGYFLAEGGASRRLIRVFDTLFGAVRGGPAIVAVLVCSFFTSFTGASGVTILALGGLLMPILLSAKYSQRGALGLLTGAGALGMLFPPCLPLILYAIIAKLPIEKIFLGALLPGVLLVVATAALGIGIGPKASEVRRKFDRREAASALWAAKWELALPVVCLVALFSGLATPVEAAAATALYAFLTQTVFTRDLRIASDVPRVMVECGLVVGGVLLILGVAQGFTNYLIFAQVPEHALDWVMSSVRSKLLFLLFLNLFLLIVGCLMDVYSAIVVVVPILVRIGEAFGIDPVHLGIIFLANLELGFLTPPVGMNLFLSSYRFGKPVSEVARAIVPILVVQLLGVLAITYVPSLTTFLPDWLSR